MVRKYCAIICLFFSFISVDRLYAQNATKPGNREPLQVESVASATPRSLPQSHCSRNDPKPPNIGHVFIIVLENKNYDQTLGSHADGYFSELRKEGVTLTNYFGVGHNSLDNYIAMISGQPPNPATQMDCPAFSEFVPLHKKDTLTKEFQEWWARLRSKGDEPSADTDSDARKGFDQVGKAVTDNVGENGESDATGDDVLAGIGCVYPPQIKTIADQLEQNGKSWRAYMEDMEKGCERPEVNHLDPTYYSSNEGYATRHNPFAYFSSLTADRSGFSEWIASLKSLFSSQSSLARALQEPFGARGQSDDTQSKCSQNERELKTNLQKDLDAQGDKFPNFCFITPNLCHDGHTDCDKTGDKGEIKAMVNFLSTWIPIITCSAAYKDGLIVITFDEAEVPKGFPHRPNIDPPGDGDDKFNADCCHESAAPLWKYPGLTGPGGGRVGAILLSPFVCPKDENNVGYNHYSMLRSVEDIFGIQSHLGYANQKELTFQEGGVFDKRP